MIWKILCVFTTGVHSRKANGIVGVIVLWSALYLMAGFTAEQLLIVLGGILQYRRGHYSFYQRQDEHRSNRAVFLLFFSCERWYLKTLDAGGTT